MVVSIRIGEVVKSKSPAEFFADNQNIAGFDNVSVLCVVRVARCILLVLYTRQE